MLVYYIVISYTTLLAESDSTLYHRLAARHDSIYASYLLPLIQEEAHKDPRITTQLLFNLIWIESRGNWMAIGPPTRGSCSPYPDQGLGLTQIFWSCWRNRFPECGLDIMYPPTNICYGRNILSYYLNISKGNIVLALNRYWGSTIYSTTQSPYTRAVLSN